MTAFTLLVICIVAQILIAGGLGIYLFRRFLGKGKAGKSDDPPGKIPSGKKE